MIIIEKEAEKKLLGELELIKGKPGYRFIHYNFSQLDGDNRGAVQEVVTAKIIAETLDNPNAKVFICQDNDLLVIAPDLFAKKYNKLTFEISNLCASVNLQDYSKLYDADENWAYIHKLVREKRDSIITKEQLELEKMRKQKEGFEVNQILSGEHLPKDLIATVNDRRVRRSESNILIVEDDAFSRKMIRNVLNKQHNVIDVEDGKDAVSSYVTTSPDVVFLDIDLPDVNGHEILTALLKLDPEAYIVMLSGNADQQNVIRAVKAGAKGFVAKPFKKDKLYSYINECPTVMAKAKHINAGV